MIAAPVGNRGARLPGIARADAQDASDDATWSGFQPSYEDNGPAYDENSGNEAPPSSYGQPEDYGSPQGYGPSPQEQQPPREQQPIEQSGTPTTNFYDSLAPYGEWTQTSQWGEAWRPSPRIVGPDFRPYASGGQWVYSSSGWSFESRWPFDWAVFHYGRWYLDATLGWLWIPGDQWGPSWVDWRYGDGYVGWAPLAPAGFSIDIGLGYSPWWFFCPAPFFADRDVFRHGIDRDRFRDVFVATRPVNRVFVDRGERWNRGPNVHLVQQAGARVTMRENLRPQSFAGSGVTSRAPLGRVLRGGSLATSRAPISSAPRAIPRSAMPRSAMPRSVMPRSAMPRSAMPRSAMPRAMPTLAAPRTMSTPLAPRAASPSTPRAMPTPAAPRAMATPRAAAPSMAHSAPMSAGHSMSASHAGGGAHMGGGHAGGGHGR
jgi:hypothetical protein